MRFFEFNAPGAGFTIDVPTSRSGPAVADVQKALQALGYDVGPPGVDGIRGPFTVNAVKQFQTANGLAVDGDPGPETVAALNSILSTKPDVASKLTKSTAADVKAPQYGAGAAEMDSLAGADSEDARDSAEHYLGRKMSDQEWNYLLRATGAEASNNSDEQAHVMGVILNRVRSGKWGNDVVSVLHAPNQFQAVTGTRQEPGASSVFTAGPSGGRLRSILNGAVNNLQSVPHTLMNFTAASAAAYGPGTNIGFRDQMIANGAVKIGGSYFA